MIDFDKYYANEECYWGLKPSKLVEEILKYKKSGSVLDLGCGEGRNALFLAKDGFRVVGIDISKDGIKKFKELAKKLNLKVKAEIADIKNYSINKKFDIIISIATLHFLNKKEINKTIKKIKYYTKIGGLNVISVFTEDNPYKCFPYLFKKDELRNFYKDWEIIKYKEFMTPIEKHKEGIPHRHGVAVLISRKI